MHLANPFVVGGVRVKRPFRHGGVIDHAWELEDRDLNRSTLSA
jgi:hypothetical protein